MIVVGQFTQDVATSFMAAGAAASNSCDYSVSAKIKKSTDELKLSSSRIVLNSQQITASALQHMYSQPNI